MLPVVVNIQDGQKRNNAINIETTDHLMGNKMRIIKLFL